MRRGFVALLALAAAFGCSLLTPLGDLAGDASTPEASSSDSPAEAQGSTYRDEVLKDGPIAYYRLDESPPGAATDQMDAYPPLVIGSDIEAGAPGALAGDPDPAFAFGATRFGQIRVAKTFDFDLDASAPCTFEAWVRPVYNGEFNNILSKDAPLDGGNEPAQGYTLYVGPLDGSTYVDYARYGAGAAWVASAKNIPYDQWSYVVAEFDGASLSLFIDGNLAANVPGGPQQLVTTPFTIAHELGGNGQGFQGELDEIAIYDKALSAARITRHWQVATSP